jgi:hypothetical protein
MLFPILPLGANEGDPGVLDLMRPCHEVSMPDKTKSKW